MFHSFTRPAVVILALAMTVSGCANRRAATTTDGMSQSSQAAQIENTSFEMKQGLVNVSKKLPGLLELGQEATYSIEVQARDNARNVTIREEIPANTKFIRSEPESVVVGNQLIWSFPQLERGSTKTLNVTLRPEQEGRIEGHTTVTVEPQALASTMVGKAKLALNKTAPATALVGSDVTYKLDVTNAGTYAAKGVVLTDRVPEGMSHASGSREVVVQVGDLQPGQMRSIPVVLKSLQKGPVKNIALLNAANAVAVAAESNTLMLLQTVNLASKGMDDQYVGKPAPYDITVTNPGDVPLKNVVITNSLPAEGKILQANGATLSGNNAVWNIEQLAPGEQKLFSVITTAMTPGVYKNVVKFKSAEGVTAESEYSTLWRGLPGLSLQMSDTADPIKEGDMTEFKITLTNQGTASDSNIRVQMSFPAGLQPVSSAGATSATVTGQNVSFAPVASLAPKQSLTWSVAAKGIAVGDNRTRVQYTSDSIKVPVSKDESTQVY